MKLHIESQGNNSHLGGILFKNTSEEKANVIVDKFVDYLNDEGVDAYNDCICDIETDNSFWLSFSVDRQDATQAELRKYWSTFKKSL
ncbi:hypothetical protein HWD03_gp111 [Alteromonas phage vB_AmeM_PT11-V22]|uniref:Uncharacterized protein n=1 Tax=Alteromonas phage vB_AmeM_PT11-V22 TaxID=2704031 RepID=A0A6C0R0N4_9CAUD|nr:hypothetical protein HWD03_gp111 [Alteromonas phage vB_AmeM_PT11-V22]QHZ59790.1 hypothetical protein [Alteromonas phage vB_AmeM_PT11-V22]